MKNAQKIAQLNYLEFAQKCHYPPTLMSFSRPNPNSKCGYGKILKAIATLPKKHRKSRMAINKAIGLETHSMCSNGRAIYGCDSYNRLVHAELIEKKNGAYQLTYLGKKYVKEMNLI